MTTLRARIRASIVGVAAGAVALFALPLGYALAAGYDSEAVIALQRDAARVAATVSDSFGTDGSTVELPPDLPASVTVGVYRVDGVRLAHGGPERSLVAAAAADAHLHHAIEDGQLAVVAPVPSDGGVTLAVRAAEPYRIVQWRTVRAWGLMAASGLLVVGLAALLARRQAARIARPLQELTASARALGDGDFTIRAAPSDLEEADAAGRALEATARRLGTVLDRERAFSADVSHQLRTPLTALLLALESALRDPRANRDRLRAAAQSALRRAEQLHETVEELFDLARDTHVSAEPLDVAGLLTGVRERWHGEFAARGRRLDLPDPPPLPPVHASNAAVRQILDVLLTNALRHGAGTATVAVADLAAGVSIEVGDEGPGFGGDPERAFARRVGGIGLSLARSLAEAEGGRLVVRRAAPRPVFSLLLAAAEPSRTDSPGPGPS
ncbi:sensor histidine kinase [Dactylosporangium sp. CS-033363]|uniref:sensor histidine kinase n=1 Tax=Dactylosporangium sp. CS-033363 TaxID=3239935 RepID=UPI003D92E258